MVSGSVNQCAHRCLWDQKPRSFDSEQIATLCNFAELVARELEASAVLLWNQAISRTLKRAMDCYHQAYLFVDVSEEGWQVLHVNQAFCERLGERMLHFSSPNAVRRAHAGQSGAL